MQKKLIHPPGHPLPRGAYSHAVQIDHGGLTQLFVTGQLAVDTQGRVVAPGEITAQTEFVFQLIGAILEAAGFSFDDIVKATTFLTNMADFPQFSAVRNRYFASALPAHTLLEVKGLAFPGCCVEVEVTAVRTSGGTPA